MEENKKWLFLSVKNVVLQRKEDVNLRNALNVVKKVQ